MSEVKVDLKRRIEAHAEAWAALPCETWQSVRQRSAERICLRERSTATVRKSVPTSV
jgi:hypothetical protein